MLSFLSILVHVKIIVFSRKVCPRFSKNFGFNFICVLVFFQKYAMTRAHKSPKIYINFHYLAHHGHTHLFVIKLIYLAENFIKRQCNKLSCWSSSMLKKVTFRRKKYSSAIVQLTLNLVHLLLLEYNQKVSVKRSKNVKCLFYKNNAEKNGRFRMQNNAQR